MRSEVEAVGDGDHRVVVVTGRSHTGTERYRAECYTCEGGRRGRWRTQKERARREAEKHLEEER